MNALIAVPILLLLVAGGVGLVLGRKGINTKTLVGAWLVLFASVGFIYLAARVAERERAWRTKIRGLNAEIESVTAGAGDADSLAQLATQRTTLQRKLADIETWRNRYWKSGFFKKPTIRPLGDGSGLYEVTQEGVVELQLAGGSEPPLNVGAELAIFFPDAESQYAFLGIFGVNQAERSDDNLLTVSITPRTRPDDRDRQAWENWELMLRAAAKPPQLLVFEDLPTDRWAASVKPPDGAADAEEISLEQALAHLAKGASLPGEYWATVTIENADAFKVAAFSDGEEGEVSAGQTIELDVQTAHKLQQDGLVSIKQVVRRRLLTDPLTALRGTRFETKAEGEIPAAGIEGIRRKLSLELASLTLMTDRIGTAFTATESETAAKKKTADDLSADRDAWQEDLAFAKQALATLKARDEQTTAALATARKEIAEKREELVKLTAQILARAKQRATPTPGNALGGRRVAIP